MSSALTFIIPVRHHENARDWRRLKSNLAQTVASIAAQQSEAWNAIIVANHGADLPALPSRFSVKWVDFPPNPLHERGTADVELFRDAIRLDKGRRILAGMLHGGQISHVMIVDDDDLIHRNLTGFIQENPRKHGWYFSHGFVWKDRGKLLYLYSDFSQLCGTSHIIRSDLYQIPPTMADASDDYVRRMLGSHVMIDGILRDRGAALEPLPFPGAIYRVGHSGSWSSSKGIFRQFFFPALRSPLRLLKHTARLRLKTNVIQRDFFGDRTA
jgi:hypothetical protein